MEDKYKLLNRELVLKNQNLKEIIKSLSTEIKILKAEQLEINQQKVKLLKEIDNYKDLKMKLMNYTSGITENLTKIITLIFPQRRSNGLAETSTNDKQQSFLLDITNRSTFQQSNTVIAESYHPIQLESTENNEIPKERNIETETSLQQDQQSLNTENDENSSILHVSRRKKRKSFSKKSTEAEQIISPKRTNLCSTSLGSDSVHEIIENHSNSDETLQQSLGMTTIAEDDEDVSSNHVKRDSTKCFKNHFRVEKEITTLGESSILEVPETIVNQSTSEYVVVDTVNDNMTISNVPCSTPYQKKIFSSSNNLDKDSSVALKIPKVLIKRLKPQNLEEFGIKLKYQSKSNRKCFKNDNNENKVENNIRENNKNSIVEKTDWEFHEDSNNLHFDVRHSPSTSRTSVSIDLNNERTKNKDKQNIDSEKRVNCQRTIRTRSTVKSLAEPSLRTKLRR